MSRYEGLASADDHCGKHSGDFELVPAPVSPAEVDRRGAARHQATACNEATAGGDSDYARSLTTLIESEIIPRLMVAHTAVAPTAVPPESKAVIGPEEVEAFAPLVMQVETDALLVHIEAILARGVAIDTVLIDLLPSTARLLGEFWEYERCDFVDVAMGLWRLQEVLHKISERLPAKRGSAAVGWREWFGPNTANDHSFGTVVSDDRSRQDGWLTDRLSAAEADYLLKRVEDECFDRMGLTVNGDCHIARPRSIATPLRTLSRNPRG